MAEQVQATIVQIGSEPPLTTSLVFGFPTDDIQINEVLGSSIANSCILYLGTKFFCSETASSLITASNASTGGSSYLVYTALLIQTGTGNPSIVSNGTGANTPFQNTIGSGSWTRDSLGNYDLTITGGFPADKTFGFQGACVNSNDEYVFYLGARLSDDVFRIVCKDNASASLIELNMNGSSDFYKLPIEIRVYP